MDDIDGYQQTCLFYAAREGRLKYLEYICKRMKKDINIKDTVG